MMRSGSRAEGSGKLRWGRQTIRPRYRFATSQGAMDEKETIVVHLEHDGVTGLGEIVPSALYGQSLESAEAALPGMAGLLGDDLFAIGPIIERLIERFDDQRAAISGVDAALYDWVGKRLGVPVWRLLGLAHARTQTTFTIGVADREETRRKVQEAQASGYDALKVKIGTPTDWETLSFIRETFHGPLLLDANEAWSPEEAAAKMTPLKMFRPTMIEQPLKRAEWRRLGELRQLGIAPLFVDESCERPADVVRLHGLVDGINIKLNKCGGIREALRMITLARGLGMQVLLGCFVSSSLAIAPALSIASLVDYADLDGHLLLADDPFSGIDRHGGTIWLSERAGLGVAPRA